ncbi:MAG: S1C family serine protease [Planctomycetota bacterium]|jgi:S1-C subfamily serine protease
MHHRRSLLLAAAALALAPAAALAGSDDGAALEGALERTIARVVERTAPSIVRLEVKRKPAPAAAGPRLPAMPGFPTRGTPAKYFERPDGPCTGVIVDTDGGVLTALYNVTDRVESITARLADGRTAEAFVVGTDPNSDLAYLRLGREGEAPDGLRPIPLASDRPAVGRFIVALGCPLGPKGTGTPTATFGIVSALNRLRPTAPVGGKRGTAMQITTRINHGNNGGPVVTMDGALLAVAGHLTHDRTSPEARKGYNSGVAFSTPVTRIRTLLPKLRSGARFDKRATPYMGVGTEPDPKGEGMRVRMVSPGSGAQKAGLRVGDILVLAGSTRVESGLDLRAAILELDVGETMEVVVLRGPNRTRTTLTITLGPRPGRNR